MFRGLFFVLVRAPFLIVAMPLHAVIIWLKLPSWKMVPRAFHHGGVPQQPTTRQRTHGFVKALEIKFNKGLGFGVVPFAR